MTKRPIETQIEGGIPIPPAWRGTCVCGKWIVVLQHATREHPHICMCQRAWFVEDSNATFVGDGMTQLPMGTDAKHLEVTMRSLAAELTRHLPKGAGFTLFLYDFAAEGTMSYISSANRKDSVQLIREWIRQRGE